MKQLFLFLSLFLLVSFGGFAQQTATQSVITLKTGERYRGEIVLRTDNIVMLKTGDGKRYQFQTAEIEKIRQETIREIQVDNDEQKIVKNQFGGIISLSGGVASASGAISISPSTNISLAMGSRNAFRTGAFLGLGIGLETIFAKNNTFNYMPVFIQIHSHIPKISKNLACGIKTGYDFALNKVYKGGPMAEITGGLNYPLTDASGLFFGLYGQIRQINGQVTETTPWGKFTGINNAALYNVGLKASFLF